MRHQNKWIFIIIILVAAALWIDFSDTIQIGNFSRDVSTRLGLDLRGGLQVLLEADVPADTPVSPDDIAVARAIIERRVNALGVSETILQTAGDRRIVAEFPGINNPEEVIATLRQTGLLEFVDTGSESMPPNTEIQTDFGLSEKEIADLQEQGVTVYHTVMTGVALDTVVVQPDQLGNPNIAFTLKPDYAQVFGDYTASHIGQYLTIVLDGKVISSPVINGAIPDGQGVIQGSFTSDEANSLAVQLRYGSLPIPLKVVESRTVGATLGEESVRKSVLAGIIGMIIIMLFMAIYYRLPGVVADIALLIYALISLMLFKLIPVVLTLPGIAGFILSIGMAVDANVLIFERLKEELRAGKSLRMAIDLGWSRAWPSIRDANISTLITTVILFWFGNTFGASLVKGFALTLALGVLSSLFTAIVVTRTLLHLILDNVKSAEHPKWFGI